MTRHVETLFVNVEVLVRDITRHRAHQTVPMRMKNVPKLTKMLNKLCTLLRRVIFKKYFFRYSASMRTQNSNLFQNLGFVNPHSTCRHSARKCGSYGPRYHTSSVTSKRIYVDEKLFPNRAKVLDKL